MKRLILLLSLLCAVGGAQTFPSARGGWTYAANRPSNAHNFVQAARLLNGRVAVTGSAGGVIDVFDPVTNQYTPGPSDRARDGHTATTLLNGRVLLAGGKDTDGSCSLYDPGTSTVFATGSLRKPRFGHTATLLPEGMVLIAGGRDSSGTALSSCELYDVASGQWSESGRLVVPRAGHTATLLPDGKVLFFGGDYGGMSSASGELYDPLSWTSEPIDMSREGRVGHNTVVTGDGLVYFIGGTWGSTGDVYDPATRKFGDPFVLPLNQPRSGGLLPDGRILVIGSYDAILFDPATRESVVTAVPPEFSHDAVMLADGRVLVPGWRTAVYDQRARGVARGDFDGDTRADILWHKPYGKLILWRMNGLQASSLELPTVWQQYRFFWRMEALGDLDGGGIMDTIWWGSYYWPPIYALGRGRGPEVTWLTTYDEGTKLAAAADFNGDGREDFLIRGSYYGGVQIDGYTPDGIATHFRTFFPDTSFVIAAADDFDGDGKADVLWRHLLRGENYIWFMDRRTDMWSVQVARAGHTAPVTDMNYSVAGTGDFDGDGKADIVWRSVLGPTRIWFMNGVTIRNDVAVPAPGAGWNVAVIGDFDADGKSDVFWRNPATGENAVTLFDGWNVKASSSLPPVTKAGWITLNP